MSSPGSSNQGFPSSPNAPLVDDNKYITRVWQTFFLALFNRTGGTVGGANVPPGGLMAFGGSGSPPPAGWLLCDGSAVSRATYKSLFTAIGTAYGIGDGHTTFNLPNFQGAVPLGSSGLIPLGSSGGGSVTLTVAQLPAHNHPVTDPGHTHGVTDPGHHHTAVVAGGTGLSGTGTAAGTTSTSTDPTGLTVNSAVTGVTTQNTGGGTPVPTLPPYAAVNWLIKT